MSTRRERGSNDQHHQRAAEMHDVAAHAHLAAAEAHGKQDHLTGRELSRRALEHSHEAHQETEHARNGGTNEHAAAAQRHDAGQEDVARLAHSLWEARGCPDGSPDEDWFRAAQQLQFPVTAH